MESCVFSSWTSFTCLHHVTFVDFVVSDMSLGVPVGVLASLILPSCGVGAFAFSSDWTCCLF